MAEAGPAARLRVAVIGAGIVGAVAAVELAATGCDVTIIEPGQPGGPQAASFGNGAWISPGSILPMSMPGLWRKVPGFLVDPLGPLTIRWRDLPHLTPWLARFLAAGATIERVERTARSLRELLGDAPARHARLAAAAGVADLIVQRGLLHTYRDRAAYEADALAWRLRRDNGVRWSELDRDALAAREPDLGSRYTFAASIDEGAHCTDPGGYVAALVRHAGRQGARHAACAATGFILRARRLAAVATTTGEIPADRAIIAAGIASRHLAHAAGDAVPLESERGYHVVVADPEAGPRTSLIPSDGRMANTLVRIPAADPGRTGTRWGLRAAGQVELASVDAPPDWRRADILLEHLIDTYPGLPRQIAPDRITRWMGHRPSTPDGLPVLSPASASADIVHAYGHGHIGLAAGAASGAIAAALAAGTPPHIDIAPFSVRRFV